MWHIAIYVTCLAGVCIYSAAQGGCPERIAVLGLLVGSTLTFIAHARWFDGDFKTVESGVLVVDIFLLAVSFALALASSRFWPIWLFALMIVQVASHLPTLINPTVKPFAYAIVLGLWGYPMLATIAVGTLRHQQRLQANGVDPSWSISFEAWMSRRRSSGRTV